MNPFANSQVRSLVESVRILERCVTAPSKLHSDLRMIRESLDLSESLEFDQEESPQGRLASKNLIDDLSLAGIVNEMRRKVMEFRIATKDPWLEVSFQEGEPGAPGVE